MSTDLRSLGGASPDAIEQFEQRNGLTLPADYRQFLTNHNGGLLSPAACVVKGPNQRALVQTLLGLGQRRDFDLQFWLDEYRDEMPPGFLVVALGAGAMLFILGTRADPGVYCWDHSHAFDGSSDEGGNTYPFAPTFSDFFHSLKPLR